MIEYIHLFPVADMASAFWQSTLPGKMIVLILFVGSAAAWTIMWTKGQQLRTASAATQRFLKKHQLNIDYLIPNIDVTHLYIV